MAYVRERDRYLYEDHCAWPPPDGRNPETGLWPGEAPEKFSIIRMAYPPGPGRKKGRRNNNLRDWKGERYGSVVTVGRDFERSTSKTLYVHALCDCGTFFSVRVSSLRRRKNPTCGCGPKGRPVGVTNGDGGLKLTTAEMERLMNEPKTSPAKSRAEADEWRWLSENYATLIQPETEEVDLSADGIKAWMDEVLKEVEKE